MFTNYKGLSVLYVGSVASESTSAQRANVLRRLGATVSQIDPACLLEKQGKLWNALHYRTGYRLLQSSAVRWAHDAVSAPQNRFDLLWVDSGELIGPKVLQALKPVADRCVLFNLDDPTGPRDGQRFASLRSTLHMYDACAVVRKENVAEFHRFGAKKVVHVWRGYDEVAHAPPDAAEQFNTNFVSDVTFVGTMIPGEHRDLFALRLIDAGVPLSIWGNRWQRSTKWAVIEPHWRGAALSGREYVYAIAGAKISLGLLSKGNRDLHTQRSTEIPYAGGLFCAQRTSEHDYLYNDGTEAVFWDDADDCATRCLELLGDDERRQAIRDAGRRRVLAHRVGNEDMCRQILQATC